MAKTLLQPKDIVTFLSRRYTNQHKAWLLGDGQWPMTITLGLPTEKDVADEMSEVRNWVDAWSAWNGEAQVVWVVRQWPRLGTQKLPASLTFSGPKEVAAIVGQAQRWESALKRYEQISQHWPQLVCHPALGRHFGFLSDCEEVDFTRLFAMLDWLEKNPDSGLAPRQLPVSGLDTKWLERRTGIVTDLLKAIRGIVDTSDFYALCGLKRPQPRIRLRILCPELRSHLGGLKDIETPVAELAELAITPQKVLIVENLETGLALPDMPGTVAFMRLGNAVSLLAALPWLKGCRSLYWGDIDSHGYVILNRARGHFPNLQSVMMDKETLMDYQLLWGEETTPATDTILQLLTEKEREVFEGLQSGTWGCHLRLEQERIAWPNALDKIFSLTSR